VETCVAQLKKGKAPGHDGLTADHLTFVHPILFVLLSLLFNRPMLYGTRVHLVSVLQYPFVKNMDGDRTNSDNYRCITISPVIIKIFEMVGLLMQIFSIQLQSDHLQYGFKRNSSWSQAIP